jgi:acetyltransferase-like isoleucine patch superfamily enzyme
MHFINKAMELFIFNPVCASRRFLIRKRYGVKCSISSENPLLKIKIEKGRNAKLSVNGCLYFQRYFYSDEPISIILKDNSTLEIGGDLLLGSGTVLYVSEGGTLRIGGKKDGLIDGAAIMGAKISVHKKVTIGYDCLIIHDVGVLDSNYHYLEYDGKAVDPDGDVQVGNHVWILGGSMILKGSTIGDGCIVGHRSIVTGKNYPENSLIAGAPAAVVRQNCKWRSTFE